MRRLLSSGSFRAAAIFAAGMLVGGGIVDVLAVQALRAQVFSVRARFFAEQTFLAERAHCRGDWLGAAFHAWNSSNATPTSAWRSLTVHAEDGSMIALGLAGFALHLSEGRKPMVGEGFTEGEERLELARALDRLGRPEAGLERQRAAKLLCMSEESVREWDIKGATCQDPSKRAQLDRILQYMGY